MSFTPAVIRTPNIYFPEYQLWTVRGAFWAPKCGREVQPHNRASSPRAYEGALPLLPQYGSQFNFATLEMANEFLRDLQTACPRRAV
jgi:hypothetical protein